MKSDFHSLTVTFDVTLECQDLGLRNYHKLPVCSVSSVAIATLHELDGQGSNPSRGKIFCTCPDRPWGPSSLLYDGCRVISGVKRKGRGVNHPPHLAPKLKIELYLFCHAGSSWQVKRSTLLTYLLCSVAWMSIWLRKYSYIGNTWHLAVWRLFFGAQVEALPGASGSHSRYNPPVGSHLTQLFAFLILDLYFYVARLILLPWRWRQQVSPKYLYLPTRLHGVRIPSTVTFMQLDL
jgi:hypothetical protein